MVAKLHCHTQRPEALKRPPPSLCEGGRLLLPSAATGGRGGVSVSPSPSLHPPSKWHTVRNVLRMCDLGQIVAGVPICLRYITGPLRKRNLSILENSRRANWPFPPRAIIRPSPIQPESQYLAHRLSPCNNAPHIPPPFEQDCPDASQPDAHLIFNADHWLAEISGSVPSHTAT